MINQFIWWFEGVMVSHDNTRASLTKWWLLRAIETYEYIMYFDSIYDFLSALLIKG